MTSLGIAETLADAARWWGVMAGVVCLFGQVSVWAGHGIAGKGLPWAGVMVNLAVSVFLVVMGTTIPFMDKMPWADPSSLPIAWLVAVCWWLLAVAGWAMTAHFVCRLNLTRLVAWTSLVVTLVLSARLNLEKLMISLIAALLVIAVGAFFLLAHLLRWEWIEGWSERILGAWSSRFQMGGILSLIASLPIDPTTGLSLWNMMPREVRGLLPDEILYPVSVTLFVLAWLSAGPKQPKLRARIAEKKP